VVPDADTEDSATESDTDDSATESESESDIAAFRASLARRGHSHLTLNDVRHDRQATEDTPRQVPRARGLVPEETLAIASDAGTMACSYTESMESLPSVVKCFRAMFEDDGSWVE
jgi:hypothetical protein